PGKGPAIVAQTFKKIDIYWVEQKRGKNTLFVGYLSLNLTTSIPAINRLSKTITMTSLGTSKGVLEIAKFAVYVTVPIGLMYFFANNTGNLHKFMGGSLRTTRGRGKRTELPLYSFMRSLCLRKRDEFIDRGKRRQYVVYPPEGPRPQSPEELREMAREIARKRGTQS
ncbi:hypothetical protein M8C21_012455, partial [Ambrosia artemisiifolia]